MRFSEKLIISILSKLIFSFFLAFIAYIPESEQYPNVGYSSLHGLFIVYCIYTFPIYLIGGIPYSYLADFYFDKIRFHNNFSNYINGILVYLAGGLLIVGIYLVGELLITGNIAGIIMFNFIGISVFASLLFYHMSLVWKKINALQCKR